VDKRHKSIIIENFNAQVGNDRTEYEEGEDNKSNVRRDMLDMCITNGWVIGNACFED
jgi:hypothetical protein